MKLNEAYQMVFDDLMKCGLFCGHYDARNGNEHFMYGVSCVMEAIAYRVSDITGDTFSDLFTKNLIKSENKA